MVKIDLFTTKILLFDILCYRFIRFYPRSRIFFRVFYPVSGNRKGHRPSFRVDGRLLPLHASFFARKDKKDNFAENRVMLQFCYQTQVPEAGCDEAGRGCLAGPVFAAAVILPPDFFHPLLNDSKQMSERRRELLREVIVREAVAWGVGEVSAEEIDRINILNASFEGMSRAVERLQTVPGLLLIDGNRFRPRLPIPYHCVVGGDALYAHIAAASVLAKTFRDDRMRALDAEYPQYGWMRNKGYPTPEHRRAVARWGLTPWHRVTFCHHAPELPFPGLR